MAEEEIPVITNRIGGIVVLIFSHGNQSENISKTGKKQKGTDYIGAFKAFRNQSVLHIRH